MQQSYHENTMQTNQTRDGMSIGVDQQSLMNLSQRQAGLNTNQSSMMSDRRHRRDKSPNTARLEALKLQMQLKGSDESQMKLATHDDAVTETETEDTIPDRVKQINDQLDKCEVEQDTKMKVLQDSIDKLN